MALSRPLCSLGFASRVFLAPKPNMLAQRLQSQGRFNFRKKALTPQQASGAMADLGATLARPSVWHSFTIASAGFGFGALAWYSAAGTSRETLMDTSMYWSEMTKARLRTTFEYFGSGLTLTAAAAIAVSRNQAAMRFMSTNPMVFAIGSIVMTIGAQLVCRSMPYTPGVGAKQMIWAVHSGLIGAAIAPLILIAGPILADAAVLTGCLCGGISMLAVISPSDQFLNMRGALGLGLGAVFLGSIASIFVPVHTRLGLGLYNMVTYGGLVLFSGFLLYDTQAIAERAHTQRDYDPINNSLNIYYDVVNIFVRIASILMNRKRK